MARSKIQRLSPWDEALALLQERQIRYRLRKRADSQWIKIRDNQASQGQPSEWVLKGLRPEVDADVERALAIVLSVGNGSWPHGVSLAALEASLSQGHGEQEPGAAPATWETVVPVVMSYLERSMKATSAANIKAGLRDLMRQEVGLHPEALRHWALQREPSSSAYRNRVDTLAQLRIALRAADPMERDPAWCDEAFVQGLRDRWKRARSSEQRFSPVHDEVSIRGIPTKAEAETYLDGVAERFPLEQWCLAMMICYGLRNHELHWTGPITVEGDGMQGGWTLVPGRWRCKSPMEHWTFPLFPSWVERYRLRERQAEAQALLHRHRVPDIRSAKDRTKPWVPGTPGDLGVCFNNTHLGGWITERLREAMPPWRARVPDANGRWNQRDPLVQIQPYDLRHTWAVIMASDPACRHVPDAAAAEALGHAVETHRKHYQRWVGSEAHRLRVMSQIQPPQL
ncbi:MAG: hypothetical protein RLZZ515_438 [Cyanobacteriota bacterium]